MIPRSDTTLGKHQYQMGRTAIFPGTFNPFTIGHRSILERGLEIFDRIVIAVGRNINKPEEETEKRLRQIRQSIGDDPRVEVISYTGLTASLAKSTGACAILRGVRNITDFEYERNLADVNKNILGVETVFLLALPHYAYISSSMVRELEENGHDISPLLG